MDFKINKIDLNNQVSNIRRTKRVKKTNKDESEENQQKFKDQFNQMAEGDESDEKESATHKKTPEKNRASSNDNTRNSSKDGSADDTIGQHIDIKV